MATKQVWASDPNNLKGRISDEEYEWLEKVADFIQTVEWDGKKVAATPENIVGCLQDEPQDMYEDCMEPGAYARMALDEYDTISNEQI